MNPTRASTWDNPEFTDRASRWGRFYDVSRELATHRGSVLVTPAVNYRRIALRWVGAIRESYSGGDVTESLRRAARDIDEIVAQPHPATRDDRN